MMSLNAMLPAAAADLDTTVSIIAQVQTATFVLAALAGLFLGPLADHYGLRRTALVGGILLAGSGFATALAVDFWTLMLGRIPAGLVILSSLSVAIASTRLAEGERRKGIGWVVSALPFSAIIGMPMFAMIAHYSNWRLSYVVLGFLGLLVTGLLWRVVPADPPVPATAISLRAILNAYAPLLGHARSILLYLADFLRGVTWFGLLIYVAAFFVEELGLSLQAYGAFMVAGGVAYLIAARLGSTIERIGLGTWFNASTVMMAAAGVIAFTNSLGTPATFGLLIMFGFMGGAGFSAITIMISESSQSGQGTTMMLRQSGLSASQAAAAATGGALIAAGGYSALGFGLGGFALLSAVTIVIAGRVYLQPDPRPAAGND